MQFHVGNQANSGDIGESLEVDPLSQFQLQELKQLYEPNSAQYLLGDSIGKPVDSIQSSAQKVNDQKMPLSTRNKNLSQNKRGGKTSLRESFEPIQQRTMPNQFTFGRNAQAKLGQSFNAGSSGMHGILGVKKASLFGKQQPGQTF